MLSLISLGFLFTTIGFIGRILFITTPQKPVKTTKVLSEIKLLVLIFISAWILSPLLHTLTQPFSDDTILALSVFLFTIHLFTQDYSYMSGLSKTYTAPVSLNAAIFGSVLLVSRLPSFLDVYSVICVAIELFALFPIFRRALKVYSDRWNLIVTWCMNGATVVLLFQVSTVVTLIYILSILFITFVCPYWLKRIQRYKNTIQGPWDEAVPTRNQPHFKL
uniref:Phosphatidylinositol N-acetylglucosaminyltransferase subunit C n=1 Tax=Arcella intermedia TaxID=1963864 RepID=A0A6B2LAJ9_9EUKA